ncbi:MAG: DNA-directed RNA polymerase subunit beta [Candidatus Paceibacterota bacterium]|jgi:DNA-directed RNA polymerase subunit beta|nr:DNA-directed RNA polymerase subunit beta [Candidatus Paceibacterota bacterium]MDD4875347.1 DNA-directed RNA polymerase subunit beta [Candidatus Paceibacterota bacterium]
MMKIKDFSKSKISFPLPGLIFLQKESWRQLWQEDLKELFKEVSPMRDYTGKEMELYFIDYRLGKPNYENYFEAKENNDSFEAPLRVTVRLVNLKTKEEKDQEVFFGNFPLLTDRGTFVINGVERVVISQLIRSPGVFFPQEIVKGKKCFGAKIIPNRGAWLEFETDAAGFLSVKIDRKRRLPATTLLKALAGYTSDNIREIFAGVDSGELNFIEETLKRDHTNSQPEALMEIYQRLRSGELSTPEAAKELIFNMFFNFERYDLSKVGRWKTWSRLPDLKPAKDKDIAKEDRVLSPEDLVSVMKEIIRLNNDPNAKPDEIDHLANRRIRTMSELLLNKLRVGLMRMARIAKDKMSVLGSEVISPSQLVNPRPFMAQASQFFSSSQFSQFMDTENALAELEHKRRLTATGPGGLTRERAGFEVRDVQPSHYGKICPIQTPEGPNVGLVGYLALYSRLNPYGFLEAPYYKVDGAKVSSKLEYLSAAEEERHNIASASVALGEKSDILSKRVEARVKGESSEIEKEKIDYVDVSPQQFLSVATALIPFLQNDDANRAQMGANMQRQAVPLVNPEPPLVGTGMEVAVAKDSGQLILSEEGGKVIEVDASQIKVKSDKGVQSYKIRNFDLTNQYTCFHQRPIVKKGEEVKKGQILAEGGGVSRGRLSLGRNVLVAFMSWRGNTYEDAIVLSEKLVKEDVFTSIHIEDAFCDVRETKLGPEVTTSDIPNVGEEKLKDLDEEGIVRIGATVNPNDILVGKISPKGEAELSAEERLLRAIFGEKAKEVKDTSMRMEHGKHGRVVGIKVFSRDEGYNLQPGVLKRIRVRIAEVRKIQVGDKLAGRHGNKGVVSKILPVEEMPFLADGTPVDVVLNVLGVVSRMNLGQVLETHLGLAANKLGYLAETPALSGATEKEVKEELKKAGLPEDGKTVLFDPATGQPFPEKVTVGYNYVLKLIHMIKDKIHMRSIGPYSLITQQPLGGKAQFGGQRFGEMEVWALEGYGAAHTLQEMLTIKSDDIMGRVGAYEAILKGEKIKSPNLPASFNLLVSELKSLSLNFEIKESCKEREKFKSESEEETEKTESGTDKKEEQEKK